MKLIAPALVLSSLCAAKVWASALKASGLTAPGLTAPIEGYGVIIPEWEVEVLPGEPWIKLNGTIQELHRELVRQNPDWDTHYPPKTTSPSLNKRAFDVQGYFCGGRWDYASGNAIVEGISYLRRVRGLPSLGPGPGNCARVSCSYKSAIWWCNDDRVGKTLQGGFGDIADGAKFIVQRCQQNIPWTVVSGQAFSTTNWNVIVRQDTDRC